MQPQQPNYDFIMNPAQPTRKSPFSFGGGSSLAMRILVVVGGLFVVMIIVAILLSAFAQNSNFDKAAMLSVAQDQTEIVRLATRGGQDSVSQDNKNFSATAKLGIASEQATLLKYLAAQGYAPDPKELTLKQSSATDAQLDSAKSSSTFDTTYVSVMKKSLTTYKNDLSAAYDGSSNSTKAVLKARYDAAEMLLTQLN